MAASLPSSPSTQALAVTSTRDSHELSEAIQTLLAEHNVPVVNDDDHQQWCKFRLLLISFCHHQELRRLFYRFFKRIRLIFPCDDHHSYVNLHDLPVVLHFLLQHEDVEHQLCEHLPPLRALRESPLPVCCVVEAPSTSRGKSRIRPPFQQMRRLFYQSVAPWRCSARGLRASRTQSRVLSITERKQSRREHGRIMLRDTPSTTCPQSLADVAERLRRHIVVQRRCRGCGVLATPIPRTPEHDDLTHYQAWYCTSQCQVQSALFREIQ